jgi:hypothetical protein
MSVATDVIEPAPFAALIPHDSLYEILLINRVPDHHFFCVPRCLFGPAVPGQINKKSYYSSPFLPIPGCAWVQWRNTFNR